MPWSHGCAQLPIVKTTDTPRACCYPECKLAPLELPPCGMTCKLSSLNIYPSNLTSFTADSPARTSVLRAMAQAWQASAVAFSFSWCASWKKLIPASFSSKTCRPYVLGDWLKSSAHFPIFGMIVGGHVFLPQKLVPRTCANDGSFWPTPRVSDIKGEGHGAAARRQAQGGGCTLAGAVKLWPTPTVRDSNTIAKCTRGAGATRGGLALVIAVGGTLNPAWVEWLMGYPTGWTELDAWATQWFRSKRGRRSPG